MVIKCTNSNYKYVLHVHMTTCINIIIMNILVWNIIFFKNLKTIKLNANSFKHKHFHYYKNNHGVQHSHVPLIVIKA
jgi:acetyltransferase-like isoleucine patch superfamily enzyme